LCDSQVNSMTLCVCAVLLAAVGGHADRNALKAEHASSFGLAINSAATGRDLLQSGVTDVDILNFALNLGEHWSGLCPYSCFDWALYALPPKCAPRKRLIKGAQSISWVCSPARAHEQQPQTRRSCLHCNDAEYLEANFYSCAAYGTPISSALRGGGPMPEGCSQAGLTPMAKKYAEAIAQVRTGAVLFVAPANFCALRRTQLNAITGGFRVPGCYHCSLH